ncbi:P-loop NTPase fold protein [Coralliovum pocilloporae]|uniref:P-loop NTPase fold protein n=1 Tax=Coralliovum pocilloporae TaxID=3066369 RepID=UPI003306ACBB
MDDGLGQELEKRLSGLDEDQLRVLATRMSLRCIPLLHRLWQVANDKDAANLALLHFRCALLAWVRATFPLPEMAFEELARTAYQDAWQLDQDVGVELSLDADNPVRSTSRALYILRTPLRLNFRSDNEPPASGIEIIKWISGVIASYDNSLNHSTEIFGSDLGRLENAMLPHELAKEPLWSSQVLFPLSIDREKLSEYLFSNGGHWNIWLEWFSRRLSGVFVDPLAEVSLAFIPNKYWDEGPVTTNQVLRDFWQNSIDTPFDPKALESYAPGISEILGEVANRLSEDEPERKASPSSAGTTTPPPSDPNEAAADTSPPITDDVQTETDHVWLCKYAPNEDGLTGFEGRAEPGHLEPWPRGNYGTGRFQPGQRVFFWRNMGNRDLGSGVTATGEVVGFDETDDQVRIKVVEAFPEDAVQRDDVLAAITKTGSNWPYQGTMRALTPQEVSAIDRLLKERNPQKEKDETEADDTSVVQEDPPERENRFDADYVPDAPEKLNDHLGRAPLALTLAYRLNRIIDEQGGQRPARTPANGRVDAASWTGVTEGPRDPDQDENGFVAHIDSPWGGGKSTFANHLCRILSPGRYGLDPFADKQETERERAKRLGFLADLDLANEERWPENYRRPWFIAHYNIWRHETVDPPWWNFYEVIRKQVFTAVRHEEARGDRAERLGRWLDLWAREYIWRLFTPQTRILVLAALLSFTLYALFFGLGLDSLLGIEDAALTKGVKGVLGIAGSTAGLLALTRPLSNALMTSLLSSRDAKVFGIKDPFESFRRHYADMMARLGAPVLVVIDDVDRCQNKSVTDLLIGLMTIFKSSNVVYLLLGDRSWIEKACEKLHTNMRRDGETHSEFARRYAEKAIQMSILLPAISEDTRKSYIDRLLVSDAAVGDGDKVALLIQPHDLDDGPAPTTETADEPQPVENAPAQKKREPVARSVLQEGVKTVLEQGAGNSKERLRQYLRARQVSEADISASKARIAETVAIASATSDEADRQIRFALSDFSTLLPDNPRRIKLIINMMATYQNSALQALDAFDLGGERWQQLLAFVILSTERAWIWERLLRDEALSGRLLPLVGKPEADWQKLAQSDEEGGSSLDRDVCKILSDDLAHGLLFTGWKQKEGGTATPIRLTQDALADFRILMPLTKRQG